MECRTRGKPEGGEKEMAKAIGANIRRIGKDRQGRTIWEISMEAGRDPKTGGRHRKYSRVHGTKAEAQKLAAEMLANADSGLSMDADRLTLRKWCEKYMAMRRVSASAIPETLNDQERRLGVICDLLGDVKLKDVDAAMIEGLYPRLREHIMAHNAGKCSSSTLRTYHIALNGALKHAYRMDKIMRNPMDKVEPPKVAKAERRSMTADEAARLLREIDAAEAVAYAAMEAKEGRRRDQDAPRAYVRGLSDLACILAVRLTLATGVRMGEAVALQWECVDEARGLVAITRGISREGRLKETKSGNGRRVVAVDAGTAAHLARWREAQGSLLGSIGVEQGPNTHVFATVDGKMMDKANFGRWWRAWRDSHGFAGWRFHELRHTQATQLLANGIDIATVQKRLGHAKASTTLDFYAHAIPGNDRAAADLLGSLYRDGEPPREQARIIKLKTA